MKAYSTKKAYRMIREATEIIRRTRVAFKSPRAHKRDWGWELNVTSKIWGLKHTPQGVQRCKLNAGGWELHLTRVRANGEWYYTALAINREEKRVYRCTHTTLWDESEAKALNGMFRERLGITFKLGSR
jgi:hypothetical protein